MFSPNELEKGVDARTLPTFIILRDLIHFDAEWENWRSHLGVFVYRLFQDFRASLAFAYAAHLTIITTRGKLCELKRQSKLTANVFNRD